MEGLQQQLQKSLAANTLLEEQLKDQERQILKKDKEIEDIRKAAAEFEQRQDGFNELLDRFQKTLLVINGSPYCIVCNNGFYAECDALLVSAMQRPWIKAKRIPPQACAWPLTQRRRSLMAFSTLDVKRAGVCR
jgi:hypothetical protein